MTTCANVHRNDGISVWLIGKSLTTLVKRYRHSIFNTNVVLEHLLRNNGKQKSSATASRQRALEWFFQILCFFKLCQHQRQPVVTWIYQSIIDTFSRFPEDVSYRVQQGMLFFYCNLYSIVSFFWTLHNNSIEWMNLLTLFILIITY